MAIFPELEINVRDIRLLVLDVDGVLTDGSITLTPAGEELKTFHVRDGSAIAAWRASGRKTAIISGRSSPAVSFRARELKIDYVRLGVDAKRSALESIRRESGIAPAETCAIGDDLPDLPVLTAVGFPVAVADACPEAKAAARFVTLTAGGRGAVREVIEQLLRAQDLWETAVARFR